MPDGSKSGRFIVGSDEWQLFHTSYDGIALIVRASLFNRWGTELLVSNMFKPFSIDNSQYYLYVEKQGYMVSSVQKGPYLHTSTEAHAFAIALRETRRVLGTTPLHDALYIERISRLLPTFTQTESYDDQTVLGTWLSAGVHISTKSFRRLCKLLSWMDSNEVESIINDAGFSAGSGPYLTKDKNEREPRTNPKEECARHQAGVLTAGAHFSLPGRPDLENFLNEHVINIIVNEDKYKRMGIGFPPAIVLYGPPGCGKTYAVERLIGFLDWPSYFINSGSIGSPYIHDTSKKIAEIFEKAIENAPSVIVIDEMEAFLIDRNVAQSSSLHHVEEVAEFLRRIPEAAQKRVLVLAMTNMIELIDPAILRKGRFDHMFEVKMPSQKEVSLLLRSILAKLPAMDDIDFDGLADKLKGRPLSDVTFIVKEAGRIAVKQGKENIGNEVLLAAIELLPKPKEEEFKIGFRA